MTLHDFGAQSKPDVFKMFYGNTNAIKIFFMIAKILY